MDIKSTIRNLKSKISNSPLPQPGLYHYTHEASGERSRIHLRVDEDGRGILLVNASRVLHLNPTAALMAYLALEKVEPEDALRCITRQYQVPYIEASVDYAKITAEVDELVRPDGACPVHDLELDIELPFSARPSAPYRMDLALTYRCNNECAHCYNARPRSYPELNTQEWIQVLDRLWQVGIPHIVFTGGEPTLREDLPVLVAHAQQNGQITGLNTNARRLSDERFLSKLVEAGLDHLQVTVESHEPAIHDRMVCAKGAWRQTIAGLRNALDSPLFVMTNTTMLQENSPYLEETLEFLAGLGVPTVGLNALIYSGKGKTVGTGLKESELPALLDLAREKTAEAGQRLIWYTPTQYCHFDPMQLELGVKGCTAALYNMCVEPDGVVIPCQSYYQPVGKLLNDRWDSIWNHPICSGLRERKYMPSKCTGCALVGECGGGCPLTLEAP